MRLWRWRFALAALIGLLGAIVYMSPQGTAIEEQFGLYWLFHLRGERTAPADVAVVAIDQASATRLELPLKPSLWPRILHARLVDRLVQAGAKVVAFDLVFDRPGSDARHDRQFAAALERAGNVILVERLDFEETRFSAGQAPGAPNSILREYTGKILPVIADAARAYAPFPLPKSSWVSYYWTFRPGGSGMPTLPSLLLQLSSTEVYGHFLDLLAGVDPALTRSLPAEMDVAGVEDLVLDLRNLFMQQPILAEQLLQATAGGMNADTAQQRIIRALIDLYGGGEVRYLNFYGPPRTIRTIPYHLLLEDDWDELDLAGKIVFVGFSAETISGQDRVRDDYQTVFSLPDGLTLSGVEIAATAMANLLEGTSIRPISPIEGAVILLLLGAGTCLLCFVIPANNNTLVHALGMVLAGILAISVYGYASITLFGQRQLWLPLAIPLMVQLPAGIIGMVTLLYAEADLERRRIQALFGGHRPEPVVRDMVRRAGPMHVEGQLVYGACLATDAEKYTSLAETMDPRQLAALMHAYYECLFEPVERYQGKVSDVIGDAMLAIWAAGFADPLLRERACLACLDMVHAVERFNQSSNRPPLPTRLGLHFGEMVLGNIGARQHYEYRAVGDIVNTANRIQGANKYLGTRLLVSEEVIRGLDNLLLRPLGRFLLPGKSQPVNLFELVARQSGSHAAQRQLCTAYVQALSIYQTGDRAGALHQFAMVHERFPEDGPTRFMLAHCRESRPFSTRETGEPVIAIPSK